ncbi:kelch-like ECH-associated protein 1 isoform X1 [Lingula anatina]|uniref:Kelch-like ECH-associated protein 1 isoform X1 n=1 Tax=Lingula anatina TaxID=7574 RepID=A0A1S3H3Z9_LINAN|nr:kelch-like ECH-associated protein 1 isoform X1 [Lingula anatina]XP_013379872.1 kelch-like ECH-associated protein 1 isoform X1 [Lingula anatina]|eukprot:XP_013379864.1 kelch-like ECH-associated protein 1 isoform X1 [Lingula anatina]
MSAPVKKECGSNQLLKKECGSNPLNKGGCYRPRPVSGDRPLDGSMHFTIMKQTKESFEVINTLRHAKKLCDVTLIAGDESFLAHKLVLAAASPYFKAMFTSGMRECGMADIPLQGITPCTLATLIEFAYTAEIHINEMNVCYLLPAATMFQMTHVVEACCTFLEHQLDPSNCIGIANFAQEHGCTELNNKAREYICKHFSQVCQSEEFLMLSPCQMVHLINQDELNVRCESEVYNAVIQWVKQDEDRRRPKLEQLLCAVRCHFLTPGFLKQQIKYCDVLKNNPSCKVYLERIFADLTLHKKCTDRRRLPPAPPVIYTAGGYLRQSLSNFEAFNPQTGEWFKLADLPLPRSGLATVVVHHIIYAVGGRNNSPDGNMDSNAADCYEPFTNLWRTLPPMSVPRNRVGVGNIDGMLYAVGGSHGTIHHKSVERFDPEREEWSFVAPMATPRIGVGVATINRLLYAVGGFDGHNRLASTECYYPETDEWKLLASMNTTRSGAGVVSMDQYVYAVGGYDGTSQLRTVERLDTEANVWEFVAPMNRPRSALACAVLEGKLYALGGYDGNDFLSSVECYNPDRNEWTEVTNMSCGRSGHGVCIGMEPCTKFCIKIPC